MTLSSPLDESLPTLAVYLFGYNLERILYPWRESLLSALELVGPRGAVYFCECGSTDRTYDELVRHFVQPLSTGQLQLRHHTWEGDHTIQAHIGNFLLDEIGTQYDYALKLDADEVLYDNQWQTFDHDLAYMRQRGYRLGKPHYTHLCPDDRHEFDFIYRSKAVISDTRAGLRFRTDQGGDACALAGGLEYQTSLEVLHLGKMEMGRRREALDKEVEFTKKYTALGFPDPRVEAQRAQGYIDYRDVFAGAAARGEFRPFAGPYPSFLKFYLEAARERESIFQAELAAAEKDAAIEGRLVRSVSEADLRNFTTQPGEILGVKLLPPMEGKDGAS